MIGDETGTLFTYTKGAFSTGDPHLIASASKWFTSATIMRLIDQGILSLSDNPQDHLTYWTSDPMDERAQVTLEQLLSFTSGFNTRPASGGCTSSILTSVQLCARSIYSDGLATTPGAAYSYGPDHMHIAAAMAEVATGKSYAQIFIDEIATPLGLSSNSRFTFPTTTNPLASGGATSTGEDYALFLTKLLADDLVADRTNFLADRTASVTFAYRPAGTTENGDWHYALGAFVECDKPVFDADCAAAQIYSSPGAFGWTPWIDLSNGYWGLIARRGEAGSAATSVELEQQLQPLIVQALAD